MRRDRRRSGGFTLVEVLIALAVLAIAMLAVIGTAGTSTHIAGQLRDETLAHWVAMNELTALRVSPTWPSLGKQTGDANMGGRKWHWKVDITKTSDPDLLRADIDVSDAAQKDQVVNSLTGFLGRPMPNIPLQGTSLGGGGLGGHADKGGG